MHLLQLCIYVLAGIGGLCVASFAVMIGIFLISSYHHTVVYEEYQSDILLPTVSKTFSQSRVAHSRGDEFAESTRQRVPDRNPALFG